VGSQATHWLQRVAESRRWAVSGTWTGEQPLDRVFAERFARYLGVAHCTPVDHGTSALAIALEALGIGAGDEVIVPGLTWVACASSVIRVNARPVLVDISPDTLCLDPEAVQAAITSRTAAILIVHLYSAMADVEALREIASRHGLLLIEDAAQAHGATWNGQRAGSFGDIGTFSMQQGKVLTCGEGGAAVTSDPRLASLLEQLRNDGRKYQDGEPELGRMQLREVGGVLGRNFDISEFQLAVLLDGLNRLDDENARRAANAETLTSMLVEIEGLEPVRPHPQNDCRTYYHYAIRYWPEAFAELPVAEVCRALEAELGCWVHPPYRPLNRHPLLGSRRNRAFGLVDLSCFELPEAIRQSERTILLHHPLLLGDSGDMEEIAQAFWKVRRHAGSVPVGRVAQP